jgi:hypothetical protein
MTDRYCLCGQTTGGDTPYQVSTAVEQVLTGLPLGVATLEVICSCCGRSLEEGTDVRIHAYRSAEAPRWSLTRWYCTKCGPSSITKPTVGTSEVFVAAQLAVVSIPSERQHSLCLSSPTLLSFSPPERGSGL